MLVCVLLINGCSLSLFLFLFCRFSVIVVNAERASYHSTFSANKSKLSLGQLALKAKAASAATGDLAANAQDVQGIKVIAARLDGADAKTLRDSVDQFKQKLVDCVVLLAGGSDGKISLVAGVHGKALGKIKAGELVAHVARQIGGKGGGRADMAQGGGEDSPKLAGALEEIPAWVGARLA